MFVCSICSWGAQKPNSKASGENIFRLYFVVGILCGQCTRVCEEKGFCSILYSCYLWGRECFCSVFAPCLKRQHKGMGRGWQSHWFFPGYFPAISSGQTFHKALGWDEESSSVVLQDKTLHSPTKSRQKPSLFCWASSLGIQMKM